MEFSSRGLRPSERPTAPATNAQTSATAGNKGPKKPLSQKFKTLGTSKGMRILFFALLVSATILAVAAIFLITTKSGEARYVNKDGYQVVALADKQVYFGKITSINDTFISITDVYYLNQSDSANAANDVRLIKRGGEVHCPIDRMTISRAQVNFWENIQPAGQIAKLIGEWKEKNPNGQTCASNGGGAQQETTNNSTGTDTNAQQGTDQSNTQTDSDSNADQSTTNPQR